MNLDRIIAVRNHKTVYRDGDLCLKVFDASFSKAQVLNEALNHALVEETGLNVPKIQLEVQSKTCPLLTKLKDKMNRKISQTDLDATVRYELHTRLDAMPKHNKLCHGDFNPSNIIIAEDGTPYILDWSHATQGNASADVARTYLLFWLGGDIDGAEKYLDLFCAKSHTAKQYIQKWMPIVAASQTVKGNEKEREFLLTWVNVVDYE